MSRSTQFIGLNSRGKKFIRSNAECTPEQVCFACGNTTGGATKRIGLGDVEGMFGEKVYQLQQFIHRKTGKKFEEYVQTEPWSSGPMIFLALRWSKTKRSVANTQWTEEEVNSYF